MTKPKPTTDSNNIKNNSSNNNNNMGLLLVLFPQDNNNKSSSSTTTTTDKTKFTFSCSSKSLFSKTQSTISICALLFFITLLLFTISTLPNIPHTPSYPHPHPINTTPPPPHPPFALQRLGTLHRRGTKPMSDLIICHVSDDTPLHDFRVFLRLLHHSSLPASSDVVFLFPSPNSSLKFSPIITQENNAFSTLLHHAPLNYTRSLSLSTTPPPPQQQPQLLWGTKTKTNLTNTNESSLSYGSVLSFDASELDSENSLAGFIDRVPFTLRRWPCYPMLLGRVRRNFKHVMLVDVKNILILKDPLGRVRNRGLDSVLLFTKSEKHAKRFQGAILPAVVMGGARGVRRLSEVVTLEIIRAATQHRKKKNSVTESAVLSQLVGGSEFALRNKNVDFVASTESIPEAGASTTSFSNHAMIQRGASNHDLNHVIKKQLCASLVDSSVYRDC